MMFPYCPTLGGLQLYWDVEIGANWRLQEFAFGGSFNRYRLINGYGLILAQGDLQNCRNARPQTDSVGRGKTAVLVHGLGRTRHCFRKMANLLREEGYDTISVSYASTRGSTKDHAERLVSVLQSLPPERDLYFVTHSFGGLVLRKALADPGLAELYSRFRAAVILGPPNQGADLGDRFSKIPFFRLLLGKGGKSVTREAVGDLPGLEIPFVVVAGVRQNDHGYNPLLSGDDDGVVALSEVHLDGAQEVYKVRGAHSFLMSNFAAIEKIRSFFSSIG